MRTITVTGGFSGAVVLDLADTLAALDEAVFAVALVPAGQEDPPPVGDPDWHAVDDSGSAAARVLSLLVDDSTTPGSYHPAIDVEHDGQHELVWATDAKYRARRALIQVA